MDIEVQLANGEWVSVSACDATCQRASRASSPGNGHSQERPYVALADDASQMRFWLAQGVPPRPPMLGINIDTFC